MKTLQTQAVEHPIFKTLDASYSEILGQGAVEITFQPGEMIFREGEPANRFYLIREGQIALEACLPNSENILIQKIGANDLLGWSWLFPPFVWHFQARALEQTTARLLDGAHLLVSCEQNHDFGYELMKCIAQVVIHRLEATTRQLRAAHPPVRITPIQRSQNSRDRPSDLESAVANHPFLSDLSPAHLRVLTEQAMRARFAPDDMIFDAGDPANRFYAIEHGQIAIESDSSTGPVLIETVGEGDVLGWSWLYPPYYWHYSARALDQTLAIFFYGTRLREICETDRELGYELIKRTTRVVIHRLQATRRRLLEP